ncbi:MAG: hypothetical protein K6D91_06085 [Prevotella sp.]|nr:hypothetical protein [Prevotella sp.]
MGETNISQHTNKTKQGASSSESSKNIRYSPIDDICWHGSKDKEHAPKNYHKEKKMPEEKSKILPEQPTKLTSSSTNA